MARLSIIIVTLCVILLCAFAQKQNYYSDRYDNIDASEILSNNRLREQYYKCFMGPPSDCKTADATFFKGIIFDAFVTKCKKCTEKQKQNLDAITEWYVENQPEKWNAFIAKSLDEARKKNS